MADVNITPVAHVFDETGTLAENYIVNEQRPLADRDIRALCTLYGSFFTSTFVMRDANSVLVDPSKYQFGLFNELITEKTGQEIAAAVIILDSTVIAPVYVDYHCVGGPWGATNEQIIDLFTALQTDDRPVSWPNILGKPDAYKPAHHLQDIGDLYGAEYLVAAMDRLTDAFLMGDNASHDEILRLIDANKTDADAQIAALNTSLRAYIDQQDGKLQVNINNLSTHVDSVQTTLQGEIDATNASITGLKTTLEAEIQAAITHADNGDATLQQNITSLSTHVDAVQNALQANINAANQALAAHVGAQGNVHNLTAAELGVYTQAQVDSLIAGVNNNLGNYVKKNAAEDLSLTNSGGNLYAYISGAWRLVWPPQWQ